MLLSKLKILATIVAFALVMQVAPNAQAREHSLKRVAKELGRALFGKKGDEKKLRQMLLTHKEMTDIATRFKMPEKRYNKIIDKWIKAKIKRHQFIRHKRCSPFRMKKIEIKDTLYIDSKKVRKPTVVAEVRLVYICSKLRQRSNRPFPFILYKGKWRLSFSK